MKPDTLLAEQSVIGALLHIGDMDQEGAAKLLGYLRETAFQFRAHSLCWRAIRKMAAKGQYVDLVTLDAVLTRSGDIEAVGGFGYLAEVANTTPSAANAMAYADIVRQGAIHRTVNSKLHNAIALLNDPDGGTVYEKIGLIESELNALTDRANRGRESGLVHVSDIAATWTDDLEERFAHPNAVRGYTTGIAELDRLLAPRHIKPGSLVVLGARPKLGKSA